MEQERARISPLYFIRMGLMAVVLFSIAAVFLIPITYNFSSFSFKKLFSMRFTELAFILPIVFIFICYIAFFLFVWVRRLMNKTEKLNERLYKILVYITCASFLIIFTSSLFVLNYDGEYTILAFIAILHLLFIGIFTDAQYYRNTNHSVILKTIAYTAYLVFTVLIIKPLSETRGLAFTFSLLHSIAYIAFYILFIIQSLLGAARDKALLPVNTQENLKKGIAWRNARFALLGGAVLLQIIKTRIIASPGYRNTYLLDSMGLLILYIMIFATLGFFLFMLARRLLHKENSKWSLAAFIALPVILATGFILSLSKYYNGSEAMHIYLDNLGLLNVFVPVAAAFIYLNKFSIKTLVLKCVLFLVCLYPFSQVINNLAYDTSALIALALLLLCFGQFFIESYRNIQMEKSADRTET